MFICVWLCKSLLSPCPQFTGFLRDSSEKVKYKWYTSWFPQCFDTVGCIRNCIRSLKKYPNISSLSVSFTLVLLLWWRRKDGLNKNREQQCTGDTLKVLWVDTHMQRPIEYAVHFVNPFTAGLLAPVHLFHWMVLNCALYFTVSAYVVKWWSYCKCSCGSRIENAGTHQKAGEWRDELQYAKIKPVSSIFLYPRVYVSIWWERFKWRRTILLFCGLPGCICFVM